MKRLREAGWLVWLTKYWFLFPVCGVFLLTAGVFFWYGERSYIGVHDNMDLFLAQYQMLKNTGAFWKQGVEMPFLGGVSRDCLPSEFSLYSALYMLFPTYTAYVCGILGKMLLGMGSFLLLARELFPERFPDCLPMACVLGLSYGAVWFFPAFGFAFASIPLCVFLLLKIYRGQGRRLVFWYAALFGYPLLSYFSYHGLFLLGYLALAILGLSGKAGLRSRRIRAERAQPGAGEPFGGREGGRCEKRAGAGWMDGSWRAILRLCAAFLILAAGFFACEYRLFGQMLLGKEETIRVSMVNANLSPAEILKEIWQVFREGIFHADGVHGRVILPVCGLYFAINNMCYIWKRQWRELFRDPVNLLALFLLFNCVVYGLYDLEPFRSLVERLLPPLKGWQFNRTIFFNPFLWYGALFLVLLRLCGERGWRKWLANGVAVLVLLAVILTPNRYNDLYNTCYNRAWEYFHGREVDDFTYEQFYAQALFARIKADIGYQGQWAAAYGFHPAILEYNGIATLDGYLGFYPQRYKEAFRQVIAPALERMEPTRVYYDDWGARAYLYSGTDLSIVQATKTVYATDDQLYMDAEAFRALGGEYLFSRLKIANAEELGFGLLGEYEAADKSMRIYVYHPQEE